MRRASPHVGKDFQRESMARSIKPGKEAVGSYPYPTSRGRIDLARRGEKGFDKKH